MNIVSRAVVLAAGLGTRLKWMTQSKPKALIQVGDETAIEHVIRRLAGQGIDDIAINVHHHAEKLMHYLGDGSRLGVRLYYSYEKKLLDSGGGVRRAMQLLPGSGPLLVHNADVVADLNLQSLAKRLPDGGAALSLVANPLHHPDGDFAVDHGLVKADGEPRYTYAGISLWDEAALLAFDREVLINSMNGNHESIITNPRVDNLINSDAIACDSHLGLGDSESHELPSRIDQHLPSDDTFSLVKPMQQLMEQGKLAGCIHHGLWFDIGRPRDLMQARRLLFYIK